MPAPRLGAVALPIVAVVVAVLALPSAGVSATPGKARKAPACRGADTLPNADNIGRIRPATRCLINAERTGRGLTALAADTQLTAAAQSYSGAMVRDRFFDHVAPDGSTLLTRIEGATRYLAGARSYSLGENLAWGSGLRATPRQTVAGWMASPGHRRNILDRSFRQIGIGVVTGAPGDAGTQPAATYTTEFGRRS